MEILLSILKRLKKKTSIKMKIKLHEINSKEIIEFNIEDIESFGETLFNNSIHIKFKNGNSIEIKETMSEFINLIKEKNK